MTFINRLTAAFAVVLFAMLAACDEGGPAAPTPAPEPVAGPPMFDSKGGALYRGSVPASTGFTDDIYVRGSGGVGDVSRTRICVWDYATIDGDEITLQVGNTRLLTADGDDVIELLGDKRCWNIDLTTGYYYEVRIRALNEGDISPNTGAIEVDAGHGSVSQQWEVPLLTDGQASLVVNPSS